MAHSGSGRRSADKLRVFVAEDEMIITLDVTGMLQQMGYEIAGHARTGKGAVEGILKSKPDIVLMDIHLQDEVDGIQAAGKILECLDIPIVFQTASSDQITLDRARLVNPFGFILKPFDPFELRKTLQLAYFVHQKDKALRASEERWKFALEESGDGIWDYDLVQDRIDYSQRYAEILGTAARELGSAPESFLQRVHPHDAGRLNTAMTAVLRGLADEIREELRMRGGDGGYVWVLARGKVLDRSPEGKALRILGTLTDICEQKRTEQELRNSEALLRAFVEALPGIVLAHPSIPPNPIRHPFRNTPL
jgi:PAS domain S-box-containing protein